MLGMGGIAGILDKLPGFARIPEQVKGQVNDREIKRMIAIVDSMTPRERRRPEILNGSRKLRIARGSGTQPADVNRLLKQYEQMEKMMRKLGKGGLKGLLRGVPGFFGGPRR
jgi:signal recognition particle subunit SRP54